MVKLKAVPKSYAEAAEVLAGRDSVRLGNNTYLEQLIPDPHECIAVRLHSTNIVRFYSNGHITLHSGGYRTLTTKERINRFIKGKGTVYQKAHVWYYQGVREGWYIPPVKFVEGMEVA